MQLILEKVIKWDLTLELHLLSFNNFIQFRTLEIYIDLPIELHINSQNVNYLYKTLHCKIVKIVIHEKS